MINQPGKSVLQFSGMRLSEVLLFFQGKQSVADSIYPFNKTLPFLRLPRQTLLDAAEHCSGRRFDVALIDIANCDRNSENFACGRRGFRSCFIQLRGGGMSDKRDSFLKYVQMVIGLAQRAFGKQDQWSPTFDQNVDSFLNCLPIDPFAINAESAQSSK